MKQRYGDDLVAVSPQYLHVPKAFHPIYKL